MNDRPNMVMILVDDMGACGMGCAGNPDIRTPNLDALAASGMRFENCFCASPVCSPARATLLTGRMPSQHGVHDWVRAGDTVARYEPERGGERIEYLRGQTGYTDVLAAAGYECGLSGKWHLGDSHQPQKGFGFWHVHAKGGGPYYGAPMIVDGRLYEEPGYVTDAITRNAIGWLETRTDATRPFYLGVHYTAPHSPWERGMKRGARKSRLENSAGRMIYCPHDEHRGIAFLFCQIQSRQRGASPVPFGLFADVDRRHHPPHTW